MNITITVQLTDGDKQLYIGTGLITLMMPKFKVRVYQGPTIVHASSLAGLLTLHHLNEIKPSLMLFVSPLIINQSLKRHALTP